MNVLFRLFGCLLITVTLGAKNFDPVIVEAGNFPGASTRLQVVAVDNSSDFEFKVFPAFQEAIGLVLPRSSLTIPESKVVFLNTLYPLIITCSKGSYQSVFIQDGGARASGEVEPDFDGPFYVSMWLPYPHVSESAKLHIPYRIKKGTSGKVCIKIGPKGDYQLEAVEDAQFLH